MPYICPDCKKSLKTKKSLKRHMESQHPEGSSKVTEEKGVKVLEIKKPPAKPPVERTEVESQGYHCQDCGAELKKGTITCPGCGEQLVWESVE